MDALTGSPGGKVVLTDRDFAILMLVAENRFVSANQIREIFWKSSTTRNHYTRLSQFVRLGILEHLIGDGGTRLGYRLTPKGIRLLPSEVHKAKAIADRSFSYRTSFDHDKLLQKLRAVFEKSPLVSAYKPEHEVRRILALRHGKEERKDVGYKVPDALFQLRATHKSLRVALELELTMKSEARYWKIFRELLTSYDFDVVLFVAANDKMIEALKAIIADIKANDPVVKGWPNKRGMYFSTMEKVLTEKENALFVGEAKPFSLASLAKTASEKPQGQ